MKKMGLLVGITCAMTIAASGVVASHLTPVPERDARVIVEVNRNLNTLSEQGVKNTQDIVYNNIKQCATTNVKRTKSFNQLNNAFVMEVNSKDIEKIKAVPGVASVTVDEIHWKRVYNDDEAIPLNDPEENGTNDLDDTENISAITMKKPDNTYDGEGTIIAILDNEFHFRGKTFESAEWHHEVFDPLPTGTKVRYTILTMKKVSGLNSGDKIAGTGAGEEGSMYLNSKVPYYYDYGGLSKEYGKVGTAKYDVHSTLSYHGSHVASITAGNAPQFKGIAPKAQLALMKVFTEYDAKGVGEKLGLSTHTGAYDSVILSALEDCIKLKVDGINMSLGSDLDDFDSNSITLRTLTRLANGDPENGIPAILTSISAGNSGKSSYSTTGAYANWTTDMVETGILSSYANNASVMTIASGHPTQVFYENAFQIAGKNIAFEDQIVNREGTDDDYKHEFRMRDIYNGEPLEWVYVPGFGTAADYTGLDVEGKVVVVNRGSTSFANKYSVAVDKEAKALVIINNDPTASDFNFRCSFGDGFNPTMPCCLVLYKDKAFFEEQKSGQFNIINKQVSDNPNKYTVSNFSTDGATYDLDLKPEITAPGDNIKGAVPEHAMTNLTKDEREAPENKNKCYQYLSGTSMSAPNYAGAQALVLSQCAAPIYKAGSVNDAKRAQINAYRETVNMRLMSTADPMTDNVENPETNEKTLISPRIQGAGMVDLDGALNSPVYIEGKGLNGQNINKSKIALGNNPDIAKGDIKLSFTAHNESQENLDYDVKVTVMRPALAHPNNIVTKDYNYRGEIDTIDALPGVPFYDEEIKGMSIFDGPCAYKDAIKVSKNIDYYASEADFNAKRKSTIELGYYYNAASKGVDWQPLPSYTAQSTKDVVIAEITGQTVNIPAGDSEVTINPYSLTEEQKDLILENYSYGCMIEGYVTLTSKNEQPNLSIPFLGFYSGSDRDKDMSYDSAPVTEPFNFEKDITKVYPSDLVNDISKSLIGKDNANFESMIVTGYAEKPQKIDTDKILTNDRSFDGIVGFYKVGTDPLTGEYTENAGQNIYVGNPKTTNVMIIQQFILRSVMDNYFSITDKEGNVVYKSALEDTIYGDTMGKWALHKSHVDSGFLSAGYVASRGVAIVPLFDEQTGEAFASGEYTLTFNYQLASSGKWVDKSYTIHIDGDAPVLQTAAQYRDDNGVERIRFYFDEEKLSYGVIGYNRVDAYYDAERKMYYLDETREFVEEAAQEISEGRNNVRLFVGGTDFARGTSGCIIHVNDYNDFSKGFTTVQGANVTLGLDFTYENGVLTFTNAKGKTVDVTGKILINGFVADVTVDNPSNITGHHNAVALGLAVGIPTLILLIGASVMIVSSLLKKKKGGK